MCQHLATGQFSAVVDLAWGGWIKGRKTASALGLPYVRAESANHLFVQAADDSGKVAQTSARSSEAIVSDTSQTMQAIQEESSPSIFPVRKKMSYLS